MITRLAGVRYQRRRMRSVFVPASRRLQPRVRRRRSVSMARCSERGTRRSQSSAPLTDVGCPDEGGSAVQRSFIVAVHYFAGGNPPRRSYVAKSNYGLSSPTGRCPRRDRPRRSSRLRAIPGSASTGVLLFAHGGAINRVGRDATAFVHRAALFSIRYAAFWDSQPQPNNRSQPGPGCAAPMRRCSRTFAWSRDQLRRSGHRRPARRLLRLAPRSASWTSSGTTTPTTSSGIPKASRHPSSSSRCG